MKQLLLFAAIAFSSTTLKAQDDLSKMFDDKKPTKEPVTATFKTTRLNMAHSIETVGAHELDFRVSHVFGTITNYDYVNKAQVSGSGNHSLYGFDIANNIRIAFEYGITDKLTVALGRSKGSDVVKEIYDTHLKYKWLRQTTDNKIPVSVTLLAGAAISAMSASTDSTSEASFHSMAERMSYVTQLLIARKLSSNLSLQLMPTYVYRNYVLHDDENGFFALGVGGRFKFTKRSAIIIDYFFPFSNYRNNINKKNTATRYFNPLGIGYEIETGGHVFHMSVVNTGGFIEQDFLSYSSTSWQHLGIRLGFNISRPFKLY
jgi:Membrane bound beta barrel domain (DUF5777)